MTVEERDSLLDMALSATPNASRIHSAVLNAQIREFERRYEVASSDLATALRAGFIRETREVSQWLFLLKLRGRIAEQTGSDQP